MPLKIFLFQILHCSFWSSNEISWIIKYLAASRQLVTLSFAHSFANLQDEHVEAIARAHSERLESLNLSGCLYISWKSVAFLLRECQQLHSLNLSSCKQLASDNPVGILSILQRLRSLNLTSLLANFSSTATKLFVKGVSAMQQNIQELRLCRSESLTDEIVELVLPLWFSLFCSLFYRPLRCLPLPLRCAALHVSQTLVANAGHQQRAAADAAFGGARAAPLRASRGSLLRVPPACRAKHTGLARRAERVRRDSRGAARALRWWARAAPRVALQRAGALIRTVRRLVAEFFYSYSIRMPIQYC